MDATHAFVFREALEEDALRVRTDDSVGRKDVLIGRSAPSEPVMFTHHMGRIPKDLIPGSDSWIQLISDKFRDVLCANSFSGWRSYPVEVYGANGKLIGGYHGLSITGRCGKIDDSKSPIIEDGFYPTGIPRKKKVGLFFPPESWDGSDLFMVSDGYIMFCTERVAEALLSVNLTNVQITRASEYWRPV
ncbi:MAG: hypothetical protein HYY23_06435 [Verrucomicrobia bacterium]|nr:hypothetical protein [Verrucomicrobiota bacterium]